MSDDWSAPTLHGATVGVDDEADHRAAAPPAPGAALDAGYAALATGIGPAVSGADPAGRSAAAPDQGWSVAVLYGSGGSATGTAAPPDQDAGRHTADPWGATTYAGSRRHRPHGEPPGGPADQGPDPDEAPAAGTALLEVPDGTGLVDDEAALADPVAAGLAETTVGGASTSADLALGERGAGRESNRSLLSSSRTMAIASAVSRVTGLLRTVAIAAVLGSAAGNISDPYNTANALPNMVYELLVGGVLSSVLIPLIVYAQEHDRDRGLAYTQRLLSIATAALGAATMLAVLAAPWITAVVVDASDKRGLTSIFATLLLPEIFFYGLSALFMAVLNSRGVFGPPAWAPVLNNVVVIATVVVFLFLPGGTPTLFGITDTQILVLGIGTTLGIVVQALVLVPSLRHSHFTWQWRFRASSPSENARLREVRGLALWVLGYVVASQVGVVVIQRIGTAQGDTGYTTFAYSDLLFQVPYGIIVVSLLTALMPRMSRAAANGDLPAVVDDLGLGARLSAVALVPITFGLFVLGPSLTTTILLGKFSPHAATLVGVVLAMSAFGLLPFAIVMLQLRVFYAMHDARTPTIINVCVVAAKILVIVVAVAVFDSPVRVIEALGVGTSVSYVVGAVIGHLLLRRRLGLLGFGAVGVTVLRITVASAAGALVAGLVVWGVHSVLGGPRVTAVVSLVLGAAVGGAVMVAVAWLLRIPEIRDVAAVFRRTGPAAARNSPPARVVEPAGAPDHPGGHEPDHDEPDHDERDPRP